MAKTTVKKKTKKVLYYYRIYDDGEQLNFMKSSLEQKRIRKLLQAYEKTHQTYYNEEFLAYLKKHDPQAELIEITTISY